MEIVELIIHIPFASCRSCSHRAAVITTKLKGERSRSAQARADIYAVRNNWTEERERELSGRMIIILAHKHALTAQILISQFAQEQPTSLLFQVKCALTIRNRLFAFAKHRRCNHWISCTDGSHRLVFLACLDWKFAKLMQLNSSTFWDGVVLVLVYLEAGEVFKLPLVQYLPDKEIYRQFLFIGVLFKQHFGHRRPSAFILLFWLRPKELLVVKWHKVREHLLSKRTESTRSWPHATNILPSHLCSSFHFGAPFSAPWGI